LSLRMRVASRMSAVCVQDTRARTGGGCRRACMHHGLQDSEEAI
jgi:hypothetical protein